MRKDILPGIVLSLHMLVFLAGITWSPLTYYWNADYIRYVLLIGVALSGMFSALREMLKTKPVKIGLSHIIPGLILTGLFANQYFSGYSFQDEHFLSIVSGFILLYSSSSYSKSRLFQRITLSIILGAIGWQLFEFILTQDRLRQMGNINLFACFLLFSIPIYLRLFNSGPGSKKIYFYIFPSIVHILIAFTESRAALLCLLAIDLYVILTICKSKRLRNLSIAFATILIVSSLAFLTIEKSRSTTGRWQILRITLQNSYENIISGNGLGSYIYNYPRYQYVYFRDKYTELPVAQKQTATETQVAFNEFIQWYNEAGLLLCIAFFLFPVGLLFLKKENRSFKSEYLLIFIIQLFSFFSYPFHSYPILQVYMLVLGFLVFNKEDKFYITVQPSSYRAGIYLVILSLLYWTKNLVGQYSLRQKWHQAQEISIDDEDAAIRLYRDIYPGLNAHPVFLNEYGRKELNHNPEKGVELLILSQTQYLEYSLCVDLGHYYYSKGLYLDAIDEYKKAYYLLPGKMLPKYYLFKISLDMGRMDQAKTYATEVTNTPIKEKSTQTDVMLEIVNRFLETSSGMK